MSFPPRPPMGIAAYPFPPVGMMPMGVGMMTSGPVGTTNTRPLLSSGHKPSKQHRSSEKTPVTTVFVGNISDRAPDAMVKQMLQRCGNVLSWKRVQGASGKLQAFGFCEYDKPDSTLRCIRLLNGWEIIDKRLLVKVDGKTQALLDEHKAQKRAAKKKEQEPNGGADADSREEGEADDDVDESTRREDRVAKAGLDAIQREYHDELMRDPPADDDKNKPKRPKEDKDQGIDDLEMEEEKKDLINREIRIFRDMHKTRTATFHSLK